MTDPNLARQAVILAGGLATRMRPLTETIPKVLLAVAGEPFAHHQLRWLAANGVTDVVFSIGYLGAMVRDEIGDGRCLGVHVSYVDEGERLRGTGGALRLAYDQGALASNFAVVYGDSFLPVDIQPAWDAYLASAKPALITVFRNDGRWDESNVVFEDGHVVLYDKDRERRRRYEDRVHHIEYGLSVLSRDFVARHVPEGANADLAEVLHRLSLAGDLAGFEVTERFYEIGSPMGLAELELFLTDSGVRSSAPGAGGFGGSWAAPGRPEPAIEEGTGPLLTRPPPDGSSGPGVAGPPNPRSSPGTGAVTT